MGSRRRTTPGLGAAFEEFWRVQNPWWADGRVPAPEDPPFRRAVVPALVRRLVADDPHRFHVLVGARRIGKTTVMTQVVAELLSRGVAPRRLMLLRLDHPLLLGDDAHLGVIREIRAAAAEGPLWLFLDEVTALPHWDRWLKSMFDERWNVRVVATSSATAALRAGRDESGVGRWEMHELGPWTLTEFASLERLAELPPGGPSAFDDLGAALDLAPADAPALGAVALLLRDVGGFPERSADPDLERRVHRTLRRLKDDAVDRVVYKDIPQSFPVSNPALLEKLLYVLAGQVAQLLSPQSLAQTLGVSQPTIDAYLSYLVHSHLIFTTTNWSPTEEARQRRGRKVYFRDPAVRNAALLRFGGFSSEELGLLTENLVASHLYSLAALEGVRLAHWRDRQLEVDVVYDHPSRPLAVEVGSTSHERTGLRRLVERHPELRGRAWLVMRETPHRSASTSPDGIGTIALGPFLWAVARQIDRAVAARLD